MTLLDAMRDRHLFGPWLGGESWRAWRVAIAAVFGEPIDAEDVETFRRAAGRDTPPTAPFREAYFVCGRRAGKSRVAAAIAVFMACFRDYSAVLAPGEIGTFAVLAADRRQARAIFRYVEGFVDNVPMLRPLVTNRTKDSIEFSNRTAVEVTTASYRHARGLTLLGAVADELAFWRSDDSANPDVEILAALRPSMATVPDPLLLCISSPHGRTGALYDAHRRHYGRDASDVLVWQADTRTMNPAVPQSEIDRAYEDDPMRAAAEYGAQFRSDIETFVSAEALDAVNVPGVRELPPFAGTRYVAFVDPSGGASDAFTLAIAHRDPRTGRAVLDLVRERRPPFSPRQVVAEFAAELRAYRVATVAGDRYAGEWPREAFREHRINYRPSERSKTEIYSTLLPKLNSGQVELLDNRTLLAQFALLERHVARGGRESIDHPPGAHDDLANAAAGALLLAADRSRQPARRLKLTWGHV